MGRQGLVKDADPIFKGKRTFTNGKRTTNPILDVGWMINRGACLFSLFLQEVITMIDDRWIVCFDQNGFQVYDGQGLEQIHIERNDQLKKG